MQTVNRFAIVLQWSETAVDCNKVHKDVACLIYIFLSKHNFARKNWYSIKTIHQLSISEIKMLLLTGILESTQSS